VPGGGKLSREEKAELALLGGMGGGMP